MPGPPASPCLHQAQFNISHPHLFQLLGQTLSFLWGRLSVLHHGTWLGEMSEHICGLECRLSKEEVLCSSGNAWEPALL